MHTTARAKLTRCFDKLGIGSSKYCPFSDAVVCTGMIASDMGGMMQFDVARTTFVGFWLVNKSVTTKLSQIDNVLLPKFR